MKLFYIKDEVRKANGKEECTYYEYAWQMKEQALNRYLKYQSEGYAVKKVQKANNKIEIKFA